MFAIFNDFSYSGIPPFNPRANGGISCLFAVFVCVISLLLNYLLERMFFLHVMRKNEDRYFRLPLKYKVYKILFLSLLQIYLLSSIGYALYELISFKRLLDIIIVGTLGGTIALVSISVIDKKY